MAEAKKNFYKISEIAKFFDITTTTLRYYEDFGLLTPAYIDESSNYRYYDTNNVNTVAYIINMRKYGMGMSQIKKYFNGEYTLDEYIDELKKQRFFIDKLIKTAELKNITHNQYNVDYTTIPPMPYIKKECFAKDLDTLFSSFYDFLNEAVRKVSISDGANTFIEFDSTTPQFENLNVVMGFAIKDNKKSLEEYKGEINGIHTFHKGSYESIGGAYSALREFSKNNNVKLQGNAIEFYYESFNLNKPPEEFLTEIVFPIKK